MTARKRKLRKTNTYKRNHKAQTVARFKWPWPTARGAGERGKEMGTPVGYQQLPEDKMDM